MYLTPWGKDAGLASGLMSLARASVPSLLAIVSTNVTQKYGPAGLLDVISIILVATNLVFWPLLGLRGDNNSVAAETHPTFGGEQKYDRLPPEDCYLESANEFDDSGVTLLNGDAGDEQKHDQLPNDDL
eukprot:CAMPEP_0171689304 /NCGR_PEP_ID=MMETSP0991-20121206/4379_1 /TAXON_ID=483369 /ORGANISM="non described non described, Strain CCMP2098" /LENGTH=128 /DNA_ID=CAMNT_0012277347 /DNA_START=464 /DNA_END=850 /DNA_ORIENTATION=+